MKNNLLFKSKNKNSELEIKKRQATPSFRIKEGLFSNRNFILNKEMDNNNNFILTTKLNDQNDINNNKILKLMKKSSKKLKSCEGNFFSQKLNSINYLENIIKLNNNNNNINNNNNNNNNNINNNVNSTDIKNININANTINNNNLLANINNNLNNQRPININIQNININNYNYFTSLNANSNNNSEINSIIMKKKTDQPKLSSQMLNNYKETISFPKIKNIFPHINSNEVQQHKYLLLNTNNNNNLNNNNGEILLKKNIKKIKLLHLINPNKQNNDFYIKDLNNFNSNNANNSNNSPEKNQIYNENYSNSNNRLVTEVSSENKLKTYIDIKQLGDIKSRFEKDPNQSSKTIKLSAIDTKDNIDHKNNDNSNKEKERYTLILNTEGNAKSSNQITNLKIIPLTKSINNENNNTLKIKKKDIKKKNSKEKIEHIDEGMEDSFVLEYNNLFGEIDGKNNNNFTENNTGINKESNNHDDNTNVAKNTIDIQEQQEIIISPEQKKIQKQYQTRPQTSYGGLNDRKRNMKNSLKYMNARLSAQPKLK